MEFSWEPIIQIALVAGLVYVVVYNFFQKKKFANYADYLAEKKSKLDRTAYTMKGTPFLRQQF